MNKLILPVCTYLGPDTSYSVCIWLFDSPATLVWQGSVTTSLVNMTGACAGDQGMICLQANSSVDAVVCLQSLHTIQDQPRFLAEVQRVLLPGSPFIFLQPGRAHTSGYTCTVDRLSCFIGS